MSSSNHAQTSRIFNLNNPSVGLYSQSSVWKHLGGGTFQAALGSRLWGTH